MSVCFIKFFFQFKYDLHFVCKCFSNDFTFSSICLQWEDRQTECCEKTEKKSINEMYFKCLSERMGGWSCAQSGTKYLWIDLESFCEPLVCNFDYYIFWAQPSNWHLRANIFSEFHNFHSGLKCIWMLTINYREV